MHTIMHMYRRATTPRNVLIVEVRGFHSLWYHENGQLLQAFPGINIFLICNSLAKMFFFLHAHARYACYGVTLPTKSDVTLIRANRKRPISTPRYAAVLTNELLVISDQSSHPYFWNADYLMAYAHWCINNMTASSSIYTSHEDMSTLLNHELLQRSTCFWMPLCLQCSLFLQCSSCSGVQLQQGLRRECCHHRERLPMRKTPR